MSEVMRKKMKKVDQADELFYQKEAEHYKRALALEKDSHEKTRIRLMMRENENHAITQSTSYRLARKLAMAKGLTKTVIQHLRYMNPKTQIMLARNRMRVVKAYRSDSFTSVFKEPAGSDLAVILHLYYVDMFPYFIKKLKNLENINHDLFITIAMNGESSKVAADIKKKLPRARVAVVPNCGRDILPFVQVIKQIENKGYKKILKLHSKKSLHRNDGNKWRSKIIDNLLPDDEAVLDRAVKLLDSPETALIGPADEYVSLLVNMHMTAWYVQRFTEELFGKKTSGVVMRNPDEYGFFSGSMFWAKLEVLIPMIDKVDATEFEPELGQQDSTLAHALERLFNLVPELQSKKMYGISGREIRRIDYHTTNIPTWSDLYKMTKKF